MFSSVQIYLSLYISAEEEQAAGTAPGAVTSMGWVRVAHMKRTARATQQNSCARAKLCSPQTLPGARERTASRCSKGEPAAVNPEGFAYSVAVLTLLQQLLSVFLGAHFSLDCLHFCQTPQC